jgi:hypothetical protein
MNIFTRATKLHFVPKYRSWFRQFNHRRIRKPAITRSPGHLFSKRVKTDFVPHQRIVTPTKPQCAVNRPELHCPGDRRGSKCLTFTIFRLTLNDRQTKIRGFLRAPGFLMKPVARSELIASVRKALDEVEGCE